MNKALILTTCLGLAMAGGSLASDCNNMDDQNISQTSASNLFTNQSFASSQTTAWMDLEWSDEVSVYRPDFRSLRVFSMTFSVPTIQKEPAVASKAANIVMAQSPDYVMVRGNVQAVEQFRALITKQGYESNLFIATAHTGSAPFWAQAVWGSKAQLEREKELESRYVWCERTIGCARSVLPNFVYSLASMTHNLEKLKANVQLEEISESPCIVHVAASERQCLISLSGFDLGTKTLYGEAAAQNLMYWRKDEITKSTRYQNSADIIFMGRFNHTYEQLDQIDVQQLAHYSALIHLEDEESEPLRHDYFTSCLGWEYDDVFASPTFDQVRVTLYPISRVERIINQDIGKLKELKAMASNKRNALIHQPVIAAFVYDYNKSKSHW